MRHRHPLSLLILCVPFACSDASAVSSGGGSTGGGSTTAPDAATTDAGEAPGSGSSTDGASMTSGSASESSSDSGTDGTTDSGSSTFGSDGESDTDEGSSGTAGGAYPDVVMPECEGGRYEMSSYRSGDPLGAPVFVVGINGTPGWTSPPFDLTWTLPGEGTLVVTAYDRVTWNIHLEGEGSLSRIVAIGYELPTVNAPGVDEITIVGGNSRDYQGGHEYPGLEGEQLLTYAEALTGEPPDGFFGCYESTTAFITQTTIGEGTFPPPLIESDRCSTIRSESGYCVLRAHDSRYGLVGLDTGAVCFEGSGEAWDTTGSPRTTATTDGHDSIVCDALSPAYYSDEATVARIDHASAQVQWTDVPCESVARAGERILVRRWGDDQPVQVFDDFDAVVAGTPVLEIDVESEAERMSAVGDTLFVGTQVLETYSLTTGMPLGVVELEDLVASNVLASSSIENALVVLERDADVLRFYDPVTGASTGSTPMGFDIGRFSIDAMSCLGGD